MERPNAWKKYKEGSKEEKKLFDFAEDYRMFISTHKTERECTEFFVSESGFKNLDDVIAKDKELKPGDKVYAVNHGKAVALFIIGKEPLENGMNILGAHIDSPRLDLKQVPLYEDTDMALFDTHYYGGIKKYQYVTLPLALHGVIAKKDGTVVKVNVGDDLKDPVFGVTDLLIHLAADQMKHDGSKVVEGENLDVLIGSRPLDEALSEEFEKSLAEEAKANGEKAPKSDEIKAKAKKELVKKNVLRILKAKYDISEEDFLSAEIEVVPAGEARDYGFDRSMIMGYGQDDRVCAYPSYRAIVDYKGTPKRTSACLLVDKEEIGSVGASGMESRFFENTVAELIRLTTGKESDLAVRRALKNSKALSSDVSAAFDPLYASTMDKKNAAYFGRGLVLNKYTGARGKSGSNDASAEYVGLVRKVFDDNKVYFQTAELGKVDQGGGGTIAYIIGNYDMNVIDSGVAVLSMHSPWEITSKVDIYEAYLGYLAFLKDA